MTQLYRVVISGRTIGDVALADLKTAIGQAFKLQGAQLERMVSGKPLTVSRNATTAAAEKLLARLQSLGLEASIEAQAETPPDPPPVPSKPADSDPAVKEELFALKPPVAAVPSAAVPSAAVPSAASPAVATAGAAPLAAASAETVCPKCGEAQPKRTLCRQCGLDMPRYLAAQQAADEEARAERLANQSGGPKPGRPKGDEAGDWQAGLLSLGFSGRFGRLDYLAGSLLSTGIWLLFALLAVYTGVKGLVGLGILLSVIYGLRCIALRLHDTGRTGWLTLVALVPLLGALMALLLLFVGGDDDDNEYGTAPADHGGLRAITILLLLSGASWLSYRDIAQDPEKTLRLLAAMSVGQAQAEADEADDDESPETPSAITYSSINRIDIYVIAGCSDCDRMLAWLGANGLHASVYNVDSDRQAAERLHSITGDNGRIMLPVLEVNGKLLPGNPTPEQVHSLLRQE